MDFKKATDELLSAVSHDILAAELGVSVATVRQARLHSAAKAHRNPPKQWLNALINLAEARALHFENLLGELRKMEVSPAETGGATPRGRLARAA